MNKLILIALYAILNSTPPIEMYVTKDYIVCEKASGDLVFALNKKEIIRITQYAFYVEGRKVIDDKELYQGFKRWIEDDRGHLRRVR